MKEIGDFPKHIKPVNLYPHTDSKGELSYAELHKKLSTFTLAIYNPTNYLTDEDALRKLKEEKEKNNFNQIDRERSLLGMIRTNFLKRLESSAHSLSLTLERTIEKIKNMICTIDRFVESGKGELDAGDWLDEEDEEDEDDEFLIGSGLRPYSLSQIDTERWRDDLLKDQRTLSQIHESVSRVTPERDSKLMELVKKINEKVTEPTKDKDGQLNRKLLVFTTFKDTAEYLYHNLERPARELNIRMAMVAGDVIHPGGQGGFEDVLSRFSPHSHNKELTRGDEIDLLIGTDCISEGQNLQDCDTVVNYDIHWNPVRLIQRFGRIDRIGSKAEHVGMINFWPTKDMNLYLNLTHRVEARMMLADTAATGDENHLENHEEHVRTDLKFRDKQLLGLREEVGDLDDYDEGLAFSDFTLDYFFAQLTRYLEKYRERLEATPNGAYAVVSGNDGRVIFFLRHCIEDSEQVSTYMSQISPYYLVTVRDDGSVLWGHMQPKQTLELFDRLSSGETEPIQKLCDAFDNETKIGRDMAFYSGLLKSSVEAISRDYQKSAWQQTGTQVFQIPKKSEQPTRMDDFELVTWLVVKGDQK